MQLNCYRVHEDGDVISYFAAASAGDAMRVQLELSGVGESERIEICLVPDEKIPDAKIEHSEDDANPGGLTLREALAAARREDKAQLLCSSEC